MIQSPVVLNGIIVAWFIKHNNRIMTRTHENLLLQQHKKNFIKSSWNNNLKAAEKEKSGIHEFLVVSIYFI